ncbi:MAG: DUF2779 domain-containing protein [Gammaproteobacteria bacterium]|nr:DUF2779 domain-containing protein [archaeon]MBL7005191.1 DUF2779 domain-containing protein [Gammaproteobacteria bacterium]
MEQLSKSLYVRGLQCKKSLWLKLNNSSVLKQPDDSSLAAFSIGNEIGELACDLFPNSRRILYNNTTRDERVAQTRKWLDEGVKTIYEATFEFDGVLVMVDILHKDANGHYEIYEVKSSTWSSKKPKIKDVYIQDVAIQYYVLSGCGLGVAKASVTLLNTDYVRGDKLDISQLFTHQDVTTETKGLQDRISIRLGSFQRVLSATEKEPDIDIGWHCKNPYECDAFDYCWKEQRQIPEYSVFNIFPLTKKSKSLELYQQGIINVEDIPSDMKLSEKQQSVVDSARYARKGELEIDKLAIQSFLDSLSYPLYHFDFETFQQPIPEFKGVSSYQQIPFQYSLHIEQRDETIEHKEFLGIEGEDPRQSLVEKLVKDIPLNVTTLAFNASFEQMVLKGLAKQFPQHKEHLLNISNNIVDLAILFQKKHYYLPEMKGKYSIKIVLPLLVPEMEKAYRDLDLIHNGGEAMQVFAMLGKMKDKSQIKRYRRSLLEYCKLDTLAMVRILNVLKLAVK